MDKVLLVRPEESRSKYDFKGVIENECLDLEIIYAILENEYDVSIFDLQVEPISLKTHLQNNHYDIIYIEGRSFQESFILEYAKLFKESQNGLVIIGGQHCQINYSRLMIDEVDYILCGYNYYDLKRIIKGDTKDIYNLCIHRDKWIINEFKEVNINDLPLPNRKYFYDHPNNYQYLELGHAMWIRTAFSCPYKCEFCIRRHMNNSKYSRRDLISVIDEIEANDNEVVYIVDDDFLYDRNYLIEFIEEIKRRNIKRRYICYGRSDFISKNEDILKAFKDIGLYYVLVGLEDIRDNTLTKYNKLNSIENNERCIEICKELDIHLMAMFILDLDYKRKDFYDLYSYIKKKDLRNVAVSIYTPELGLNHSYEYITDNTEHFDYLHLVSKPKYLSVKSYYFHYYILLIRLFLKGRKDGVYDFIDYSDYIKSFIAKILKGDKE